MKTIASFLVLVFCLAFIGCGRLHGPVEQIRVFAEEKEELITEMGKKLVANPTEGGVDEARKVFEAKKDSLKAKKEAIKSAPQGFNADWKTMLMDTEARHEKMFNDMSVNFLMACDSEPCKEKWKVLEKDFKETAEYYQS